MPRIPDSEIERLKTQVSLLRLIEARGIALVKQVSRPRRPHQIPEPESPVFDAAAAILMP